MLKRFSAMIAWILVAALLLAGCGDGGKQTGPEVGVWHAEINLNDLAGSMSEDDKMLLNLLAGSTMFEIDVEFAADNTFAYVMNTDKLTQAISGSANALLGLFINVDISLFVQRIVEAAMKDAMATQKMEYYGTYTRAADGLITATDGENIYFKVSASSLVQVDESGNPILRFTRVS